LSLVHKVVIHGTIDLPICPACFSSMPQRDIYKHKECENGVTSFLKQVGVVVRPTGEAAIKEWVADNEFMFEPVSFSVY
jgi:hypothetical protein